MNMLVCINVSNQSRAGLYRSIFNRLEWIKNDKEIIDSYEIVSLKQDYVGLLKVLNKKTGFKNSLPKNVNSFIERGLQCRYIKVKTTLLNRCIEKLSAKYQIMRKYRELKKNVDLKKYDLINVHEVYAEGAVAYMAKREFGIRYVLTVHGSDINLIPYESEEKKKIIIDTLENATKVIFVSNGLLNTAKSLGYSGHNSIVIPNGFDKSEFYEIDKEMAKNNLGVTKKVVGFAGNLQEIKRADKLPEIFKEIYALSKDIEFLVIGDGPYREKLLDECERYKIPLNFYGRVKPEEVNKYMNAMDVLILPSRNEGWPCVVFEAMACGAVVVGTNKGGITEAISNYGYVVDEGYDFEKRFAKKTIQALKKNKVDNEYKKYLEKYTWKEINTLERNLFDSLCNTYQ